MKQLNTIESSYYRCLIVFLLKRISIRTQKPKNLNSQHPFFYGAVMTKKYDTKGRLVAIIPPGSNDAVERYEYLEYPQNDVYFTSTKKYVRNADGTESVASEYTDLLGRTLRKESPGINNKFLVEESTYNTKGQLTSKTLPYLEGIETLKKRLLGFWDFRILGSHCETYLNLEK